MHQLAEWEPDEQRIDAQDVQGEQRLVRRADMRGGREARDETAVVMNQLK